jgi:hypothetical protein
MNDASKKKLQLSQLALPKTVRLIIVPSFKKLSAFSTSSCRYCECFASGSFCKRCNCSNCCNDPGNAAARQVAIDATLDRNPNAFRPKFFPALSGVEEGEGRYNKVKAIFTVHVPYIQDMC